MERSRADDTERPTKSTDTERPTKSTSLKSVSSILIWTKETFLLPFLSPNFFLGSLSGWIISTRRLSICSWGRTPSTSSAVVALTPRQESDKEIYRHKASK